MSDLISRQDAIDAIKRCESADSYDFNHGLIRAMNAIADIPSAQQEVVRCKDCKYHEDEEPGAVYCPDRVGGWVSEDFFCADGERRTE